MTGGVCPHKTIRDWPGCYEDCDYAGTDECPYQKGLRREVKRRLTMKEKEAWEAYDEAMALAGKVHDEAVAQARKAHDEAVAQAWIAYNEAVSRTWIAYNEAVADK